MRQVVEQHEVTDVASLIQRVQEVGQQLIGAQPKELAVGNIVRRVLGVIRMKPKKIETLMPIMEAQVVVQIFQI